MSKNKPLRVGDTFTEEEFRERFGPPQHVKSRNTFRFHDRGEGCWDTKRFPVAETYPTYINPILGVQEWTDGDTIRVTGVRRTREGVGGVVITHRCEKCDALFSQSFRCEC